jgi:hypothetical protein
MPTLDKQQITERAVITMNMLDEYRNAHPYLTYDEATAQFFEELDKDPVKVRIINALAAANVALGSIE